ncbi:hypothetical protein ACVWZL_008548 [Bradyrhizobium sp. GM2.4]
MPRSTVALEEASKSQPQLPVWLCHMWQRLDRRRLGLILGAGVSIDAGLPTWKNLVERLTARFPAVQKTFEAHRLAGLQETYITQIAYALHQASIKGAASALPRQFEQYQVDSTWMEVVHQELYRDIARLKYDQIIQRHSYLKSLGQLVCRTELTVNFNFDDLVDEAAIGFARDRNKVQPEVISRPKIETRRDASVIYHINGSLPREARRRRSENLVFTEDAFADVLISPTLHESDFLMSRFATTTFLLLGTSLNDNSLKNMLRAGMKRNPANHHYIIYWEDPARRRTDEERRHIFDVNLDVYNLISIFLETKQIVELIDLLNEEEAGLFEAELVKFSPHPARRKYYLVGSVVAGKSSNLEGLRCFSTFEEWSGRAPETMYQDHRSLTASERKEIDEWLYSHASALEPWCARLRLIELSYESLKALKFAAADLPANWGLHWGPESFPATFRFKNQWAKALAWRREWDSNRRYGMRAPWRLGGDSRQTKSRSKERLSGFLLLLQHHIWLRG